MTVAFTDYAKIKDNLCICYVGSCNEYLVQLKFIRPAIEKELPGIKIHICCKDNVFHLIQDSPRIIRYSEIKDKKRDLAHIIDLKCNMQSHPILKLIEESNLTLEHLPIIEPVEKTKKCVIFPNGVIPTKSIDVEKLRKICMMKGYTTIVGGSLDGAGWVVGVENEYLYEAGIRGIRTTLIPTGIGTKLYKKLFPKGEIFENPDYIC